MEKEIAAFLNNLEGGILYIGIDDSGKPVENPDIDAMQLKVAKYAGKDKVDLIENEEYGYCSLIKATNNVLEKMIDVHIDELHGQWGNIKEKQSISAQ